MPRTTHSPSFHRLALRALATGGLLAATAAPAQVLRTDIPMLDDSGVYRQEVRACREGRTAESLSTCLEEARNAAAERRRGLLTNEGNFMANALARCDVHRTPIDKAACRERILGQGDVSGSVVGGGLLRELEVVLPQEQQTRQAREGPGGTGEMGGAPAQEPAQDPMLAPAWPQSPPQAPITPAPSYDLPADPGMPGELQQQRPFDEPAPSVPQ